MALHRGIKVYQAPPSRRSNHVANISADAWALLCDYLEVLGWYFLPTGYTIPGSQHNRVQIIRENGDTMTKNLSVRFWALDSRERRMIHPLVMPWLKYIKDHATRFQWLLTAPHRLKTLPSITTEVSDLLMILQLRVAFALETLEGSTGSCTVVDVTPSSKANLSPDLPGSSLKNTCVQQAETGQTGRGSTSKILPRINSSRRLERTARRPSLRKKGRWTENQVRDQYLQP